MTYCIFHNDIMQSHALLRKIQGCPLVHLGKSQAQAFQIPILCLICDKLNSVNWNKTHVNQILVKRLFSVLNFHSHLSTTSIYPCLNVVPYEQGDLKGKELSDRQSYHVIHIPHSMFVYSLVCPSLLRKSLFSWHSNPWWCHNRTLPAVLLLIHLAIILRKCLPESGVDYYLVPLTWWLVKARRNWYICLPQQTAAHFPKLA